MIVRIVRSFLFATLLVAGLVGCAGSEAVDPGGSATAPEDPEAVVLTDLAGRVVEVPTQVERVVAIGPGALRLVVYAGGTERVVGVEEFESRPPIARPYTLANPQLLDLPVVGAGGPDSAPDAERLITVEPDVIFVGQIADAAAAEKLASATGIPVVVVSYGRLGSLDEPFFESLALVGEVLGTQEHAGRSAARISDALDDLAARVDAVKDGDRPGAYIGALGFRGAHGIESTQADYLPFAAIGANNVAAAHEQQGSVIIDKEQLLEWNPTYVFVDRGGLALVREDVKANRRLYEGLGAVREGRVFSLLPFNSYWTNVELALANAYFAGTVLFPEQFADIDAEAMADELAIGLVGAPVYEQLTSVYGGGFGAVDLFVAE